MEIYTILNTKTGKTEEYTENEIKKKFESDSFYDNNISRYEYESYLKYAPEEEKKEYIEYWKNRYIFNDESEYLSNMIEYEKWTSPEGIEPIYKVISVETSED